MCSIASLYTYLVSEFDGAGFNLYLTCDLSCGLCWLLFAAVRQPKTLTGHNSVSAMATLTECGVRAFTAASTYRR